MQFKLEIACDNAAFTANDQPEFDALYRNAQVAHILESVVQKVRDGSDVGTLHDTNGNLVGRFYFEEA